MESILQTKRECYLCKGTQNLHYHHIFGGKNRALSEKYGFGVYLCGRHHNLSDFGVHFNNAFDLELKRKCQEAFEKKNSRERFMEIIGRNYLED